jgi:hypothetical protein
MRQVSPLLDVYLRPIELLDRIKSLQFEKVRLR